MAEDVVFIGELCDARHPINCALLFSSIVYHSARNLFPNSLVFRRIHRSLHQPGSRVDRYGDSMLSREERRSSRGQDTVLDISEVKGMREKDFLSTSRKPSSHCRNESGTPRSTSLSLRNGISEGKESASTANKYLDDRSHRHRHRSSSQHSRHRSLSGRLDKDAPAPREATFCGSFLTTMQRICFGSSRISQRRLKKGIESITHLVYALPVSVVHYFCVWQQEVVTLPILFAFLDRTKRSKVTIFPNSTPSTQVAGNSCPLLHRLGLPKETKNFVVENSLMNEKAALFDTSSLYGTFSFLFVREAARLTSNYIVDLLFVDDTIVPRLLRSRHSLRRNLGWAVRLTSHTLIDTFLTNVLLPGICLREDQPNLLSFTIPGLFHALAWSASAVCVESFALPLLSHLFNRAMVTLFEGVEYFVQRRYIYVEAGGVFSDSSQSTTPAESDGEEGGFRDESRTLRKPSDSRVKKQKVRRSSVKEGVFSSENEEAAKRIEEQEKIYERERRDRHRARKKRREANEKRVQRAIFRAIFYRVASLLVAQVLVERPLNVLIGIFKGRSMMHLCGLLQMYEDDRIRSFTWTKEGILNFLAFMRSFDGLNEEGELRIVRRLRSFAQDVGYEVSSVGKALLRASGKEEVITRIREVNSISPTVFDSIALAWNTIAALAPLYTGWQCTAVDVGLDFYLATWRRIAG